MKTQADFTAFRRDLENILAVHISAPIGREVAIDRVSLSVDTNSIPVGPDRELTIRGLVSGLSLAAFRRGGKFIV